MLGHTDADSGWKTAGGEHVVCVCVSVHVCLVFVSDCWSEMFMSDARVCMFGQRCQIMRFSAKLRCG